MTSKHTIEEIAKVINGPHDAKHIGQEKLIELQNFRWDYQTSKYEKIECINQARAVLERMNK